MLNRIPLVFILIFTIAVAKADIGETYDLLNRRELLAKENEALLGGKSIDSLSKAQTARYIENLNIIRLIDEEIFKSQKETVDRLSGISGYDQYVNQTIALFSFLLAVLLALSLYLLYIANNKLNAYTSGNMSFFARMGELFNVVLSNVKPTPVGKNAAVNKLVLAGLIFMFISFVGYLLKTLGV